MSGLTYVPRFLRVAETVLPTRHGTFRTLCYRDQYDGFTHLALVRGDVAGRSGVLTRVHSECLTGEVLGSLRCDCGEQFDRSLAEIGKAASGVLVYLCGHEGRGVGLVAKLRAYELQDSGLDTIDANLRLGLPVDTRDYAPAAGILDDLRVASVHLMTNNPAKQADLIRLGVVVDGRVPIVVQGSEASARYLTTKRERMGHLFPVGD